MDELISRQAAIKAVQNRHMMLSKEKVLLINDLEKLPSAQSRREERKIGEWIYDWGDWDFETCKCSECGNHMTTPIGERYNFCPNCGAKMEVNNESN